MVANARCDACRSAAVERVIESKNCPGLPYQLCGKCATRLESYALRPLEWFNLAAKRTSYEFFLHDDFYEQDGTARQPQQTVDAPEQFRLPNLEEVQDSSEQLLDYCMTRWDLDDKTEQAIRRHDAQELVASLERRVKASQSPD